MIFIYGDSHGVFSFKNLSLNHKNYSTFSITMNRIGRDNIIINYNKDEVQEKNENESNIIILVYGEVDCRCHIKNQINIKNINEDEIINDLVYSYFRTIKNNISNNIKIIIVAVIPPIKQSIYESKHGPITHEYPFKGTDEERIKYTNKVNNLLEKLSIENNYIFFNPYKYYTGDDGILIPELSDDNVHIGNNSHILEKFMELYNSIK